MNDTRQLHVHRLDPDLKARLVAEADERDESLNDVAVGILAERFGVRFVGSGRRSPGAAVNDGPLVLPVPETLYRKIDAAVARQPKGRRSKVAVVEDAFRAHFADADLADAV